MPANTIRIVSILAVLSAASCTHAGFNPLKFFKMGKEGKAREETSGKQREDNGAKKDKQAPLTATKDMGVETNVVYAVRDGEKLALSIAFPKDSVNGGKKLPAIIYVHGGGFVAGNRSGFNRHIAESANRGYVAASIDYRLADGTPSKRFPAAVKDVGAAVRWLKENADRYNVDPQRIGLYGGSAGGNLVLMAGLASELVDRDKDRPYPGQNSRVKAIVNFCGPTDYATMLKSKKRADPLHVMAYLEGKKVKELKASARKASPIYYIDKDDPPVLTLHGTKDSIVPYKNAIQLHKAIKRAGGRHRLVPLEGGDHPGLSKIDFRKTLRDETFAFFDEEL